MTSSNPEATAAPNTNWLKCLANPENATLDIVAVHGLNIDNNDNHSNNTWTSRATGKNWLKDFLPSLIPYSRVLTYQYNANVAFGSSAAGVAEQANNLLVCLSSERKDCNARPIIFVAHSMGGIIVKEALAKAYHGDGSFATIVTFTHGIVFFGVPHLGSDLAKLGSVTASIVRVALNRPTNSFLSSIKIGSDYHNDLNTRYSPLLSKYKYVSICETLPEVVSGFNMGVVIPKDSAILGLDDSQEIKFYPDKSHTMICKFSTEDEAEWRQLATFLSNLAQEAVSISVCSIFNNEGTRFDTNNFHRTNNETHVTLSEAVEHAQFTLEQHQEQKDAAHDHQESQAAIRVDGDIEFFKWVLSILIKFPLGLLFTVAVKILAVAGVTRNTVTDNAEQFRQNQEQILTQKQQSIQRLDEQLGDVTSSIRIIQRARDFLLPQPGDRTSIHPIVVDELLRRLHGSSEEITHDLHSHRRAYETRSLALEKISKAQQQAEGLDDEQFWTKYAETGQELMQLKQERSVDNEEDGTCPSCSIM